jgi:4-diphosphocytidyl-2-C-methyl-D-erythritol kinase
MTPEALDLAAHAKINLYLKILGTRSDGFHEIESLICPIELHDRIRIAAAGHGIRVHCRGLEEPLPEEKNLAYKAAALFVERVGIKSGVDIRLEKNIPSGAGLGGGSSDAAAVLVGMDRLFGGGAGRGTLLEMASKLGSDVPFFITGKPAWVRGRGEIVEPVAEPPEMKAIVLVKPPFGVSTVWAYRAWDERQKAVNSSLTGQGGSAKSIAPLPPGRVAQEWLFNSFEACVFDAHPGLKAVRTALLELGAEGALMSGSGSTVFGVFAGMERAGEAAGALRARDRSWKVVATRLIPSTW